MDKIIEQQIVNNAWHQVLYGYNNEKRTEFLKNMESNNPIVYGKDVPMAIYLDPYGIALTQERKGIRVDEEKQMLLNIIAREYLNSSIVYQIISRIESNSEIMGKIENQLLRVLWENCQEQLKTVKEHLNKIKTTLCLSEECFNQILFNKAGKEVFQNLDFEYFMFEWFWKSMKEVLKNNSQFNIIIDYRDNIALESYKAIMSIVNCRCSESICMKIATDPSSWPVWVDFLNVYSENPHDYSICELDDSLEKYLSKQKSRWNMED